MEYTVKDLQKLMGLTPNSVYIAVRKYIKNGYFKQGVDYHIHHNERGPGKAYLITNSGYRKLRDADVKIQAPYTVKLLMNDILTKKEIYTRISILKRNNDWKLGIDYMKGYYHSQKIYITESGKEKIEEGVMKYCIPKYIKKKVNFEKKQKEKISAKVKSHIDKMPKIKTKKDSLEFLNIKESAQWIFQ